MSLFGNLLPRHLQIIYEINRRFLRTSPIRFMRRRRDSCARMSMIEEGAEKRVRMAHLAIVGSHSVNGVAELHTRLLRERELKDFDEMYPERFNNKTNGVTPAALAAGRQPRPRRPDHRAQIGDGWVRDLSELTKLEPCAEDADFRREWRADQAAEQGSAWPRSTYQLTGERLDPESIFDVQVKRIHEYKRQTAQHPARDQPVAQAQGGTGLPHPPAYLLLRRQGRPQLPHRQDDHPAHLPRRRTSINRDTATQQDAQSRLSARTTG